ncbi:MAG TPA: cytochrome c oxidase subunit II [Anaerolineales bacterium]|nr:cytochrome c oxidase subunit II [Anaerolineales bacterium]
MGDLNILIIILVAVAAIVLSLVLAALFAFLATNFEKNKAEIYKKVDPAVENREIGLRQNRTFRLGQTIGKNVGVLGFVLFGIGLLVAGWLTYQLTQQGQFIAGGSLQLLPAQASEGAAKTDGFFYILLSISVIVFLLVQGLLVFAIIRFRRRKNETGDGASFSHNTTIEIVWTTIPALLVIFFAFLSWTILADLRNPPVSDQEPLVVQVTGRQYSWLFTYPQYDNLATDKLFLPIGRPVQFEITSEDVLHSFWVPAFRLKQDAVPGRIVTIYSMPKELGTFPIMCAELCGQGHGGMSVKEDGSNAYSVNIVNASDFDTWVMENTQVTGEGVFAKGGCAGCHTFAPLGAAGAVGPNLTHIGTVAETRIAGTSAQDYIHQSIVEPGAFLAPECPSGAACPNAMTPNLAQTLSAEEIDVLVAYLLEQK